jgi:sugar lactone lactonase YvrE
MKKIFPPFLILLLTLPFFNTYAQIITTVAGGGTGNGVVATDVGIIPVCVATDNSGNYYFASQNNNVVYKVVVGTNVITVVAGNGVIGYSGDGGPATAASLNMPVAIAVDAKENIYIVDAFNNRIRKVDAGTGIITTVAGGGIDSYSLGDGGQADSAELNYPSGVALDKIGNIYIAELYSYRIRKVTVATGIITTVAGNGISGFSGDGGQADTAELDLPIDVKLDGNGNIYIVDLYNQRIRKVTASTGVISTVAGNGTKGYSGDGGPADSAELNDPVVIALDSSGNIYIADFYNNRVRRVDAATGIITTIAGNGYGAGTSSGGGYSGDGGPADSAELFNPDGVALDGRGNVYIADVNNNRIRKVDAGTGIITTITGNGTQYLNAGDGGPATSAELYNPLSVALDSSGNIYIADFSNRRIQKVTVATGIITTVAGGGNDSLGDGGPADSVQLNYPSGVALDASGNIYIADQGNNRIRKVDGVTGIITTVAGGGIYFYNLGDGGPADSASLNDPAGVALDSRGNIYIADEYNRRVRKVDAVTGIITTVAGGGTHGLGDGGPADSAGLSYPTSVALDSIGNIYIADYDAIRRVDFSTGIITTVAGKGKAGYSGDGGPADSAELNNLFGVALDGGGNIYIADQYNQRIRKVDASTGIITTVAGKGIFGYSGDGGPADSAEMASPCGIALDASGNMYIAEYASNRVRKVTAAANGIAPIAQTVQLNLYPNPATGYLIVSAPGNQSGALLSITDMQGRVLHTEHLPAGAVVKQQIDVSPYAAGVYVLSMITADTKMSRQFVVMK